MLANAVTKRLLKCSTFWEVFSFLLPVFQPHSRFAQPKEHRTHSIMMATPVRSNTRSEFCQSSQEALLAKKKNPLEIDDDCPVCEKLGVVCSVGCHPSDASAGKNARYDHSLFLILISSLCCFYRLEFLWWVNFVRVLPHCDISTFWYVLFGSFFWSSRCRQLTLCPLLRWRIGCAAQVNDRGFA